jgi:hypothetical protein
MISQIGRSSVSVAAIEIIERQETGCAHYPTLSVEQVNGAIAFYLDHEEEVEQAMEERRLAEGVPDVDVLAIRHPHRAPLQAVS